MTGDARRLDDELRAQLQAAGPEAVKQALYHLCAADYVTDVLLRVGRQTLASRSACEAWLEEVRLEDDRVQRRNARWMKVGTVAAIIAAIASVAAIIVAIA